MSTNEKAFLVWLLVAVVVSLVLHHLLASALFVLGRAVAMNFLALPGASNLAATLLPFC